VAVLAAACVGLGVGVGVLALRQAALRATQRAELKAYLRLARPLSGEAWSGDCVLRTPLTGPRRLFAALSPTGRAWCLARWEGQGLVMEQVQEGGDASVRRFQARGPVRHLELYRTGGNLVFYFGSRAVSLTPPDGWESWLVDRACPGGRSLWAITPLRSELKRDAFMRTHFGSGDRWTVEQGAWRTSVRGGGEGNAANAFVLEGRADGDAVAAVSTGWEGCANYSAEVSALADSPHSSYWLEAGRTDGARVAFGWNGAGGRWELLWRPNAGEERVLSRHFQALPAGNWSRVGLKLRSPFEVVPLLDGVPLGAHRVPDPVYGPARLLVRGGPVFFDDFQMAGRDAPPEPLTPLLVKSKAFAKKPIEAKKDADFVKWVHDTLCCERARVSARGQEHAALRYAIPLYGDFEYEGTPTGVHRVLIRLEGEEGAARDLEFRLGGGQWRLESSPPTSADLPPEGLADVPRLRLVSKQGALYQVASEPRLLGRIPTGGPFHISICTFGAPLDPEQHTVRSATLWDEFFEAAPVGWTWWSGEFGMQYRWACQPYWNWMGGWSRQLAAGFSRAAYFGDQSIEYYVSLKDLIAGQGSRRYVRGDLNFSFCTDGRSVASGYSLLFGGLGDSGTYLVKGGEVLASTRGVRLPPFAGNPSDVHWRWWHVRVEKRGPRIRVWLDEQPLFDVVDDDPLAGGHLAFWTVGNGFLLARVRVAAEQKQWRPERSWGDPSEPVPGWEPLEPGAVRLLRWRDGARVINRAGGGTFAVRWIGGPVELTETPVLELPFEAGPGARVNLHLQVSGHGYLLPLTAPVEHTPAVLCPAWFSVPTARAFLHMVTQPELPAGQVLEPAAVSGGRVRVDLARALRGRAGPAPVLESLIVGNSSNDGYLLAGFGGNAPGDEYRVGTPLWLPAGAE